MRKVAQKRGLVDRQFLTKIELRVASIKADSTTLGWSRLFHHIATH